MISFPIGSVLPMLAISLSSLRVRELVTFFAVIVALVITGYTAAYLNGANKKHSAIRNVFAGVFTMLVTYAIGSLFR